MTFEEMVSVLWSWPVVFVILAAVMSALGCKNCRLNWRARKIQPVASDKTIWVLTLVAGAIFSARVTAEYYPELFGFVDFFTHGTGFEPWWMIVAMAMVFAGFAGIIFFVIAEVAYATKESLLKPSLNRMLKYDAYDAELVAAAAVDPLAGCKFGTFKKDTDYITETWINETPGI